MEQYLKFISVTCISLMVYFHMNILWYYLYPSTILSSRFLNLEFAWLMTYCVWAINDILHCRLKQNRYLSKICLHHTFFIVTCYDFLRRDFIESLLIISIFQITETVTFIRHWLNAMNLISSKNSLKIKWLGILDTFLRNAAFIWTIYLTEITIKNTQGGMLRIMYHACLHLILFVNNVYWSLKLWF